MNEYIYVIWRETPRHTREYLCCSGGPYCAEWSGCLRRAASCGAFGSYRSARAALDGIYPPPDRMGIDMARAGDTPALAGTAYIQGGPGASAAYRIRYREACAALG